MLEGLHPLILDLRSEDLIQAYYNEDTCNYFIICKNNSIKTAYESLGILTSVIIYFSSLKNKINNVFVMTGLIYSVEQIEKYSIDSYKRVSP